MPSKTDKKGLVRVGELPLFANMAGQFVAPKPMTSAQGKLVDAALSIREEPDAVELAYMARELVQCTLPHSDPGDVPVWVRTNGNVALVMVRTALDMKNRVLIGYPYGS